MRKSVSVVAMGLCVLDLAACGSSTGPNEGRDAAAPTDVASSREASVDDAGSVATRVTVDSTGAYAIVFRRPAWTFAGTLGVAATNIVSRRGTDAIGSYQEVAFAFSDTSSKSATIRAYERTSAALLTTTFDAATTNGPTFPTFDAYPHLPHQMTYGEAAFAPISFTSLTADSPFVFFDDAANTFILSAASNFMNAATVRTSSSALSSGIDPAVTALPAGFSHRTMLVAEEGIRSAFGTWGDALLALTGKKRAANDATFDLERFGYWTDNGAAYYYAYDASKGYAGTLLAVRDYFTGLGVPLAYMQLDSWFYPKGPMQLWSDGFDGLYEYSADPSLFPGGLASFQKTLGLPLITHARWIDPSSPYRSEYAMSNNVSIDPRYWKMIADYIGSSGVAVYEQDWLNINALPRTDNLTDQDAFTDDMAAAMANKGIDMQYCMPLPRHFLQSTKYPNLRTTRVSVDRFSRPRYEDFLYVSLLASSLGEWPWSDTFNSAETDNLLLATLSAGVVGVGDAIGAANVENIFQSVRADGVIVKPDSPIVPLDETFIDGARAIDTPLVASTFTDFGGLRASYVYAFNTGKNVSATFTPKSLGYTGKVFVLNYFKKTGKVVDANVAYKEDLTNGSSYYVVVPVGPSGLAFLGDEGKFVSLGKKRIARLSDHGSISASVVFARGESTLTVHGYAPSKPVVTATSGAVGPVTYDTSSRMFTLPVSSTSEVATITLR